MKAKKFSIYTCEHRVYDIKAKSKKDAIEYLSDAADLDPKDRRVKLVGFGDFKIIDEKEQECPICHGYGHDKQDNQCSRCFGSGTIDD